MERAERRHGHPARELPRSPPAPSTGTLPMNCAAYSCVRSACVGSFGARHDDQLASPDHSVETRIPCLQLAGRRFRTDRHRWRRQDERGPQWPREMGTPEHSETASWADDRRGETRSSRRRCQEDAEVIRDESMGRDLRAVATHMNDAEPLAPARRQRLRSPSSDARDHAAVNAEWPRSVAPRIRRNDIGMLRRSRGSRTRMSSPPASARERTGRGLEAPAETASRAAVEGAQDAVPS